MNTRSLLVFLMALLFSCQTEHKTDHFRIVYKNDREGNTLQGSKAELIKHIRGGAEIRIGWGGKGKSHRIEHLSDPIWIAVLDETEVIAHLDAQVLSKTDWENLSANYADSTLYHQEWRVVITTKGEFDAVWIDRNTNKLINRRPQNHVISWFSKGKVSDVPLYSTKTE